MISDLGKLKRFERRVRLVRAWKGLGLGLLVGAGLCAIWAALDWLRLFYTEWSWLGGVTAVAGFIGLLVGYFRPIATHDLTDSIDRRAGLQDRLTTSLEVGGNTTFESALQSDARERLAGLKERELYPIRVSRIHGGFLGLAALASTIFLLGNSPILLPPDARKEREELKKLGESVERVAKPLTEHDKPSDMTDAERRMAEELRKLQRDLQKSKIDKEESLQQANELAKQTKELVKERSELVSENLAKAESALEKLQKAELEKSGMKLDPETLKALQEMNRENREMNQSKNGLTPDPQTIQKKLDKLNQDQKSAEAKKADLEVKKSELQRQLDKLNMQLKSPNLTSEQRKALEEMQKQIQELMKKLEKELAEANRAIEKIMKDKQVQELLKKISEHPKMKELQELAAKLAENAKVGEMGEMPQLTDEQIQQMKEKLKNAAEEIKKLAEELSNPAALDEYLEQLKQALENMDQLELNAGICLSTLSLFNLPIPGLPSPNNPIDFMTTDTGKINKSEKGEQGQGSTSLTQIKGDRQKNGDESYIEIKGPTTVGNRSGIKYTKVLPSYRKKAEEAMNKKAIPKQHEKRVKEYFESLTGGK